MFRNLNRAAFDTFDPDNYDPNLNAFNGANGNSGAGSFTRAAKPGNKMQVNLTLTNNAAEDLTLELFSWLDSLVKRRKLEYVTANYLYIPQDSFEGLNSIVAGTDDVVGWDQDGNLVVRDGANPTATVGCSEIAYRSFFDASGVTAFQTAYMRFTSSNDAQIDQPIIYFQKSFSGGIKENRISPRAYFKPTQFQNQTIDITVQFSIGIDKGLRTVVLAGQTVKLNLFIQMWTNQTLNS